MTNDPTKFTREQRLVAAEQLRRDSRKYGDDFVLLEDNQTGEKLTTRSRQAPLKAWRNRQFFVALWMEDGGQLRLSVNRAAISKLTGHWVEDISWDDLMACKRGVGFGDAWAVETYPPEAEVVDIASIRHLFILPDPPAWAWRNQGRRRA